MADPIAVRTRYCGLTREQVETLDVIDHATNPPWQAVNELSTWATNKDIAKLLAEFHHRRILTPSAIARRVRNLSDMGLIVCYYTQKLDGRYDRRTIEMTAHGLDMLELLYRAGHLGVKEAV